MKSPRYQELLRDESIIKGNNDVEIQLLSEAQTLSIGLYYSHEGFPKLHDNRNEKRLIFSVYSGNTLDPKNLVNFRSVKKSALIMVNADCKKRAMTYKIDIDEKRRIAEIKVHDYPAYGYSRISEAERLGIRKRLSPVSK